MPGSEPPPVRLTELAQRLERPVGEIVATLVAELDRALADVQDGLRQSDLTAVGLAAHAALTSALMLDAEGLLAALRGLELAARAGERDRAAAGLAEARAAWAPLRARLADA